MADKKPTVNQRGFRNLLSILEGTDRAQRMKRYRVKLDMRCFFEVNVTGGKRGWTSACLAGLAKVFLNPDGSLRPADQVDATFSDATLTNDGSLHWSDQPANAATQRHFNTTCRGEIPHLAKVLGVKKPVAVAVYSVSDYMQGRRRNSHTWDNGDVKKKHATAMLRNLRKTGDVDWKAAGTPSAL